jgi:hypothetical protein
MKILWLSGVLVFLGLMLMVFTIFTEYVNLPYYWIGILSASIVLTLVFSMLPSVRKCKDWSLDSMKSSYTLIKIAHVILALFMTFIATAERGGGSVTLYYGIFLIPTVLIMYTISMILGFLALRSEVKKE